MTEKHDRPAQGSKLHRAVMCKKEDHSLLCRKHRRVARIKERIEKRISIFQAATASFKMGVPLWNSRRYTAVHLASWSKCCWAAAGSP